MRLTPTEADPFRYTESGGTDVFFEGRLTWKLSRLVFASEELAVERLRRQRESEKQKLAKRVLATLFAWYRARDRVLDPGLLEEEKILAWIEVFEAEAILDVLTDGWFGEEVAAPDTQATDDDIPASRRPVPPPTPGSDARAAATPSGDAPQRLNGGHHAR